tara:strand:- start:6264 stop:6518 length:255 start_codon:yes stop_codon:yes gene_type:complete
MKYHLMLLIEGVVVGLVTSIIGISLGYLVFTIYPLNQGLHKEYMLYNKNFILEILLFLTGFLAHISFELIGANKWYCKNGLACI